ncbi:hypothetical protein PFISCL1PPCAC_27198, partial [Pristionchus fissidentatus]
GSFFPLSMCCCTRLHRHQIHLISYGCVSFGLITTGLVFTVFAIFQKDSQIGKVWLAGPTTMVVGLVLCGKVIIDWGPAMMHAREGSIDSRLDEHMARQMMMKAPPNNNHGYHMTAHQMQLPEVETGLGMSSAGIIRSSHPAVHQQSSLVYANVNAGSPLTHKRNGHVSSVRASEHPDCIIYSQYDTPQGSTSGGETSSVHHSQLSTHTSSSATIISPEHSVKDASCGCKYGSMRKTPPSMRTMYQGESFVMNERSF